jgi:hypothetical protein
MTVVWILVLVGIACGGGLEDVDGTLAIPSPIGLAASMSCAAGLLYNIIQHDRQGRR